MTYDQLLAAVRNYFGDTSRPASQTKQDLESLAEECTMMAEALGASDEL